MPITCRSVSGASFVRYPTVTLDRVSRLPFNFFVSPLEVSVGLRALIL
jgi:hypothetical protein